MTNNVALERRVGREVAPQERTRGTPYYRPVVDILETPEELRVVAEMPGVRPEDIDLKFEKGILTIHGKAQPRQTRETSFLMSQYGVGDFYRAFEVSEAVDAGRISADYSDGLLTLHLPKAEQVKARKIEVRTK